MFKKRDTTKLTDSNTTWAEGGEGKSVQRTLNYSGWEVSILL